MSNFQPSDVIKHYPASATPEETALRNELSSLLLEAPPSVSAKAWGAIHAAVLAERAACAEEIERLRGLVEDAWLEGYSDGVSDGHPVSGHRSFWVDSHARRELGVKRETLEETL